MNVVPFLAVVVLSFLGCQQTADAKTTVCWLKHGGVCVQRSDPCPFSNATNLADTPGNQALCPNKDRRCCIPPARSDVYNRQGRCGISGVRSKNRIHGGSRTLPGEYPWQVSLQYYGSKHCGASIISPEWILTAAHCTYFYDSSLFAWRVVAGSTDLSVSNGLEQIVNISQIIQHPSFHNPRFAHDIALLKLATPLKFNRFVNSVCLPANNETFQNMVCHVSGYGATENSSTGSDRLLKVNKPVVATDKCQDALCSSFKPIYNINICGGFKAGERDACQGDSGGPFVCRKKDSGSVQRYVLAGVVSHGSGCGDAGKPGIYTRVENYLGWIDHFVQNKTGEAPEVPIARAGPCNWD